MRFYLLVEGYTEDYSIAPFLKRWLDPKLSAPIGIRTVRHDGWANLVSDLSKRTQLLLKSNNPRDKVAGVIALMDLYGPTFYPSDNNTVKERYLWARKHFQEQVNDPRFRMFFAVHEVEAWLLSDPSLFPPEIAKNLVGKANQPEAVNFDEPPGKLLQRLYGKSSRSAMNAGRDYKKVVNGAVLFSKLNPEIAYEKCPHLKLMLDEMLDLARAAGL